MSAKGLLRFRGEAGESDEAARPRPPSIGSDGGSLSPESRATVLEEEKEDSFDEGIDDILASNPSCNLCGHNFYDTADFLGHVRMHFSGGKEAEGKKRRAEEGWEDKTMKTKTPRVSPP